jgi:hypothetical protein
MSCSLSRPLSRFIPSGIAYPRAVAAGKEGRKEGKQGWEEGMSESVFVFGSLLTLLEFMCSEVVVV